ncbi:MAG: response regulator [Nitrospirota bacterium]
MKILLIEDDDAVRNTILSILTCRNHTVDEAKSAEEALLMLPADYDLVIVDVLLKQMDGLTLLERITGMRQRIPVLMITGLEPGEIESACLEKGAAGFLHKPFRVQELLSLVDRAVHQTGTYSPMIHAQRKGTHEKNICP